MDLVEETKLLKIYWLEDVKSGYGVWSGVPDPEATRQLLARVEQMLRGRLSRRWISNTENAWVSPPATQALLVQWMQEMSKRRALRAWADIPTGSAVARLAEKRLAAEPSSGGLVFGQFESLGHAKAWIRSK